MNNAQAAALKLEKYKNAIRILAAINITPAELYAASFAIEAKAESEAAEKNFARFSIADWAEQLSDQLTSTNAIASDVETIFNAITEA